MREPIFITPCINGNLLLSAIIHGQRVKYTYSGYTRTEAKKRFRAYLIQLKTDFNTVRP